MGRDGTRTAERDGAMGKKWYAGNVFAGRGRKTDVIIFNALVKNVHLYV